MRPTAHVQLRGRVHPTRLSRVGSAAQLKAMKQLCGKLKLELAQYREVAAFAQFGSDLDPATQSLLNRGARLTEILKQAQFTPMPIEQQVVVLYGATKGYLDKRSVHDIPHFEQAVLRQIDDNILQEIKQKGVISDDLDNTLKKFFAQLSV